MGRGFFQWSDPPFLRIWLSRRPQGRTQHDGKHEQDADRYTAQHIFHVGGQSEIYNQAEANATGGASAVANFIRLLSGAIFRLTSTGSTGAVSFTAQSS